MVCEIERRYVEADGRVVGSYTTEDLPSVREGLMGVMRTNQDPGMGRNYQRILMKLYEPETDGVVDGLFDDLDL